MVGKFGTIFPMIGKKFGGFPMIGKLFRGGFFETKRTNRETKEDANKSQTIMAISDNGNLH
jgi:hypothetical protein